MRTGNVSSAARRASRPVPEPAIRWIADACRLTAQASAAPRLRSGWSATSTHATPEVSSAAEPVPMALGAVAAVA
jgi:hypothetical protein